MSLLGKVEVLDKLGRGWALLLLDAIMENKPMIKLRYKPNDAH
jgi:hypothetical protein